MDMDTRHADEPRNSLIGRVARSGAAVAGSNIAWSSAEHCAASAALTFSASAAASRSDLPPSRDFLSGLTALPLAETLG